MAPSREVQAQFDAVLRSGAFRDPKTIEILVDRLVRSAKIDLALELLDLAEGKLQEIEAAIADAAAQAEPAP